MRLAPPQVIAPLLGLALFAAACHREAEDWICPSVAPGDLVVTELRGDQAGSEDTLGEWLEVYNASGASLDLAGLAIELARLDGSATERLLVRGELSAAPGAYVVLGRFSAADAPAYVDYGTLPDLDTSLYTSAAVTVEACGAPIDTLVYHDLPTEGTRALDGAIDPPAADANDDDATWCQDAQGDGAPGTPGQRNTPCPT